MLTLLLRYRDLEPANVLTPYIPLLRRVLDADEGSRTRLAHQLLDPGFVPAWQRAAADPLFRRAQREERERVYWAPALVEAQRDQVGPLGLAIYYDVSVNHGPGEDADSFGGILAAARGTTPPPADGGEETAFLRAVVDRRVRVLEGWGDYQRHGRHEMHHELLDAGNLELVPPIRWSVYGDSFELPDYPRPRD
jgi:chitosanase